MNIDSMGIIAPTVTGVSPASAPPAFSDSTQGSTPPIAPTGSGLDKLYLLLIQLTLMFFSVGFRPIVSNIDSMGTIAPTVTSISPASAPPAFSDSTQGSTPPIAPTGSGLDKLYLLLIQLTLMFFSVGFRPIVSNIDSMGTIAPTVTSISPASAPPAFSDSAQGCTPPIASTSGLDKVYLLFMQLTLMFLSVGPIISNIDSMGIIAPTVTGVSPASAPPAFSDSAQGCTPPIASVSPASGTSGDAQQLQTSQHIETSALPVFSDSAQGSSALPVASTSGLNFDFIFCCCGCSDAVTPFL
jgi:hypothetical protein